VSDPVRLLTTSEAGALLGVNRKTVWNRVRAGRLLEFRTPTRRLRVYAAEVGALIAGKPAAEAREIALGEKERMRRDQDRALGGLTTDSGAAIQPSHGDRMPRRLDSRPGPLHNRSEGMPA
jgi:hypothetical protein